MSKIPPVGVNLLYLRPRIGPGELGSKPDHGERWILLRSGHNSRHIGKRATRRRRRRGAGSGSTQALGSKSKRPQNPNQTSIEPIKRTGWTAGEPDAANQTSRLGRIGPEWDHKRIEFRPINSHGRVPRSDGSDSATQLRFQRCINNVTKIEGVS